LPRKTAHPPLVGNTALTCTSITVLFIAETVPGQKGKTSCAPEAAHPSHVRTRQTKIFAVRA
jgi:hypothetical protein